MLMPKLELHVGYFEIPGKKKKKNLVIIHREKRTNIWYTLYEEGAGKHPSGVTILTLKKYTYSERERGERAYPIKEKGKEPANSKVVQITENRGGVQQI